MYLKSIEIWKDINGYIGLYQVSNLGNVKSIKRNVILKPNSHTKGYLKVHLYKGGVKSAKYIHRLVAESFIPNPKNYLQVNHKDENKKNNIVDNLEWCDVVYNVNYGSGVNRRSKVISKKVMQLDLNGNIIKIWNSISETNKYGFYHQNIIACCKGRLKTHRGYLWKYYEGGEYI